MFQTTFLGHQGWLLSTEATHLLVDPLLTDGFGHGGLAGSVYPPRRVEPAACPPIDAVLLTHEHDDHFDVPSLHRLDRAIPVYLSARSSVAARRLLDTMGFRVLDLPAGDERSIGDLCIRSVPADHREGRGGDEWDVFPFLVFDRAGHGSFFTSVDVRASVDALATLGRRRPRPGIWAYANNSTSVDFQRIGPPTPVGEDDVAALARVARRRFAELEQHWGAPQATLVCGGGWSFDGERRFINHRMFPLSSEQVVAALREPDPSRRAEVAVPGVGLVQREGRLETAAVHSAFVRARPREQWPSRAYDPAGPPLVDYAPACGRRTLPAGDVEALLEALDELARYLHGGSVFRQLHSLPTVAIDGRRPELCFALRTDGPPIVLRYEPRACAFVAHDTEDPIAEFMSGLECWATDLLALLHGEIGPSALCYAGRMRGWNHDPRRLRIAPYELWAFAHPLRRPGAALALYHRLLEAEPAAVPRVPARE